MDDSVVSVYHGVLQLPADVDRYNGKAILPPTSLVLSRCTGMLCEDFLDEYGIPREVHGKGWLHHVEMVDREALVGFPGDESELEASGLERMDFAGVSFNDLLEQYFDVLGRCNIRHLVSIGPIVDDVSQRDMVLMIHAAAKHENIEAALDSLAVYEQEVVALNGAAASQ